MDFIYEELKINPNSIDKGWLVYTLMFACTAMGLLVFACINSMGLCPKLLFCICRPKNNSRWINVMGTVFIFTNAIIIIYYIWFQVLSDIALQAD